MVTTSFLNASVVGNRVRFLYRDADGVLKQKSLPAEFTSYHPVRLDDDPVKSSHLLRAIREDKRVHSATIDGEFLRVRWRDQWARRDVARGMRESGIPVLEGDVNPIRRIISEQGFGIAPQRQLYFDIEVDSRHTFHEMRHGRARVISWAAKDETGASWAACLEEFTDSSERELLEAFWLLAEHGQVAPIVQRTMAAYLQDRMVDGHCRTPMRGGYDQMLAWSGRHGDETFDFIVTELRSRSMGAMPKDIARFNWLDHHDVFERMNKNAAESGAEKQSLKLQVVGMELLGHGKDDFDASRTYEAWLDDGTYKDRSTMVRYNMKDVDLMPEIEHKTGYIALFQSLCEACGIFPNTYSLFPTVQMDGFMLRLGAEKGYHFKTRFFDKEEPDFIKEQFEGAFVLHPKIRGIVYDVHVGDFASMYPSIITTFNMSPDTKVGKFSLEDQPPNTCRCPQTGVCFATDRAGILSFAISELLRLRAYWRKRQSELSPGSPEWVDAGRRSNAYKVAANSFFGAMGNQFSRYYDEDIAESITTTGAWLAKHTIRVGEEAWGIEALYGDTDALMARGVDRQKFVEFVDHCNAELYPRILREVGCVANNIKFENEKGYKRIVYMLKAGSKDEVASKKYCNPPEAPIWMADMTFKKLGDIRIGDQIMGWIKGTRGGSANGVPTKRTLIHSVVQHVMRRKASIVKVTMESGRVIRCTSDHRWLTYNNSRFAPVKIGRMLTHVIDEPKVLSTELQLDAAWLGGIYDGEGSLCGATRNQIVFAQSRLKNPEVCDRIESILAKLGIGYHRWMQKSDTCDRYAIAGGAQSKLNFATWCKPAKFRRLAPAIVGSRFGRPDRIVKIEPDGRGEVISLTTSTGNYLAWGYASKNCGIYSYYKGTMADASSKPEIKGLAWRRGDSNLMARQLQQDIVDIFSDDDRFRDPRHYEIAVLKWKDKVLNQPLTIDEVKMTASLTKELGDYVQKVKKDGTDGAQTPHVRVAKILKQRGADVSIGTRIEFFMKDHPSRTVLPIEDFDGQCDRFYLWEDKVFKPSLTLLESICPTVDWKPVKQARPKKTRQKLGSGTGKDLLSSPVRNEDAALGNPGGIDAGAASKLSARRTDCESIAHERFLCMVCGLAVEPPAPIMTAECDACELPTTGHAACWRRISAKKHSATCVNCFVPQRRRRKTAA